METETILSPEIKAPPSKELFTEKEIKAYEEGCGLLGVTLNETIARIKTGGKKPTILIPSRGAVPVFISALNYIQKYEDDKTLLDPEKTRYYPQGIFEYLSSGIIQETETKPSSGESDIDVALYPFTADVSPQVKEGEELARKLRESCTRALIDLTYGEKRSLDLNWHLFLLSKLKPTVFQDFNLSPQEVAASLRSIPKDENREIILIDTVVSGRAAANITNAFSAESHPVTPVLAVDNTGGAKLKPRFEAAIKDKSNLQYVERIRDQFIEFPLISEDKGAVLLGVAAINLTNFNETHQFFSADHRFDKDFTPQSCLWIIPPKNYYIPLFHAFLQRCRKELSSENLDEIRKWYLTSQQIREILKERVPPQEKEISGLLTLRKPFSVTETASHIISVKLDPQEARDWTKEFARTQFDNQRI